MRRFASRAAIARKGLDRRLGPARMQRDALAVPSKGWIKAIREALGMTATQLAGRLGVSQATVSNLEKSEGRGAIQLATLRRAAEAMNCTLVYAFIPNEPLEQIVQRRAREVAAEQLRPVEHTMLIEDQSLTPADRREQLDAYIRDELDPRSLWDRM
ncbi:mobile mystery protein A [Chelatococcus sambhunathii]|uniref:Mobile mystery protein A n=1 Tax=Chelatococcus sambhunathii TaxID=363953 RepID=A0ABU1DIH3_9HYPH|nr:mobile mystery protein A [Chelatococcus sambhunathii]MDR4307932.1 mobile mystery protein A [Chelatococcus sambhunathii]